MDSAICKQRLGYIRVFDAFDFVALFVVGGTNSIKLINQVSKIDKITVYATMERCHASYVLQHVPMILQIILEPLPIKSLNACARVCKSWNVFANAIKKKRHKMEWLLSECRDLTGKGVAETFNVFTQEMFCQPRYMLLFCTTKIFDRPIPIPSRHPVRYHRSAKCETVDIGECMNRLLPSDCSLMAISANGVVGTAQKTNMISELEDVAALTLLSLPNEESLDIYTFFIDIKGQEYRMDTHFPEMFDIKRVSTVPEDKDVKVILFFCDQPNCPPEVGYALLKHYKGCVIAGGYVDNLISPPQHSYGDTVDSEASLMCIAFCGSRVHAASVVIHEEVETREEVEKVIKKLKNCNLPEEKSFAFMFACIGRGCEHFNGVENVESSVFKKYFPKTPLFGFFGNGEVGFDHLYKYEESSSSNDRSSSPHIMPKLYHAYTTIICMVSIT